MVQVKVFNIAMYILVLHTGMGREGGYFHVATVAQSNPIEPFGKF